MRLDPRSFDLGPRGRFRRLIEQSTGDDFGKALSGYVENVEGAATAFLNSAQVQEAVTTVLEPLTELPRFTRVNPTTAVRLVPESGTGSGLLRALRASVAFNEQAVRLPIDKHGTSAQQQLKMAEGIGTAVNSGKILLVDEFGEGLDTASSQHFALRFQQLTPQCWVSSRRTEIAAVFEPENIVRLAHRAEGVEAYMGSRPSTRSQRQAARYWTRHLIPALTSRLALIVEGPHDAAALHAVAMKRYREANILPPHSHGVSLLNAGAEGAGGSSSVKRLCALARSIGLITVGIIDGDTSRDSAAVVSAVLAEADAVIRLPDGVAVERALLCGLSETTVLAGLQTLTESLELGDPPGNAETLKFLKTKSLHAEFVESLPKSVIPPLSAKILDHVMSVLRGKSQGLIQL